MLIKEACLICSARLRHGPVILDRADVRDNLTVMGPGKLDSIVSADACTSGITGWAEPVVLWRAGCTRPPAVISSSINGVAEHTISENGIVGN